MASGTVGYTDTRGNRDYTSIIANQIGKRLKEASDMASDERGYAEQKADDGGTSLSEAGIGRGYFFKRALGSRFGGDAIARTRGRMGAQGAGKNPAATYKQRFRGGFDYKVTNEVLTDTAPLTGALATGLRGVESGLDQVSSAIERQDKTLRSLARSQVDMAKAIMFNGYLFQMFATEQKRERERRSARREERSIEGGQVDQLSGRGMINITPPGGSGGGGGFKSTLDLGDVARRGLKRALPQGAKASTTAAKALYGPKQASQIKKGASIASKGLDIGNVAVRGNSFMRPITKGMVNMGTKMGGVNTVTNLLRGTEKFVGPGFAKTITKAFGEGGKGIENVKTLAKTLVTANAIMGPVSVLEHAMPKITGDHIGSISTVAKSGGKTKKLADTGTVIAGGAKNLDLVTQSSDLMSAAKTADTVTDGVSTAKTLATAADAGARPNMLKRFIFGTKPKGLVKGSKLTKMLIKNPAGKMFLKKLPLIGAVAGTIFAAQRLMEGDFLGAGLELGSGILGAVGAAPASLALDGFLLARDFGAVPFKKGGITTERTFGVMSEYGQKEGVLSLEGNEGMIAGTVFGKASAEALANFFQKKKSPLEKLRYNSDHPMGTEQPNPHPPGTFLHKQFERLRQMNIIDPTMKISHNFAPSGVNNGASLANSSAEVASGDRKNNSGNNTVIMESPAGTDNKGNSGLPLTSNPAGGSEDQGLNMYAAHLVMASV